MVRFSRMKRIIDDAKEHLQLRVIALEAHQVETTKSNVSFVIVSDELKEPTAGQEFCD